MNRSTLVYIAMGAVLLAVGLLQSWQLSLTIVNLCLISAVMALGVNVQWGVADMFNVGTIGSAAVGGLAVAAVPLMGLFLAQRWFLPASAAIEAVDATSAGYLGGLGLPVVLSWGVGGLLAAAVAWPIGRMTAGLRFNYLAVATFGISEIILAVLRNEEWLARCVKNVSGLPHPVLLEADLQTAPWVQSVATSLDWPLRDAAFVLRSVIVGIGGAMLITLDGQFTAGSYQPLCFTFLIRVMVIVGGSGNHKGAILGGFLIWFFWLQAETAGLWLAATGAALLSPENPIRIALEEGPAQLRYVVMGLILVLVMRFAPNWLIPEAPPRPRNDP